jgi:hypothetical protein
MGQPGESRVVVTVWAAPGLARGSRSRLRVTGHVHQGQFIGVYEASLW